MQLVDFDPAAFLRDHWQKRPLLIRNAWAAWANPLDPDELAGLACEDDVESRLIVRKRKTWAVEYGPLAEKRFRKLGKRPWTLLVQAVDTHVPAVAKLRTAFDFIPNWRIDDVMVSYASDGGGVGPHFDRYDVFLIQGLGQRRWRVGAACDSATPLLPHDELRLIADFEATDEWLLEPGDMLYLPPGIAHDGIAVGDDCMTYSIGFRAPSRAELVGGWCDDALDGLSDDDRYTDPDLGVQPNPGEISPAALDRLHAMLTATLGDRAAFANWFGRSTSARKDPDADWRAEVPTDIDAVRRALARGTPLDRNPASRFAFVRQGDDALELFVDGEAFDCVGDTAAFAQHLCASDRPIASDSPAVAALVARLIDRGCIAFDDD